MTIYKAIDKVIDEDMYCGYNPGTQETFLLTDITPMLMILNFTFFFRLFLDGLT
jgi:hypothetical protein